jgi:hypothetical protein
MLLFYLIADSFYTRIGEKQPETYGRVTKRPGNAYTAII